MISNALDVFLLRTEHLIQYIDGAKTVEDAITASLRAGAPNGDVLRNTLDYQRAYRDLHYAAKIMSLYGFLERYIEDVIIEYVDCLKRNLEHYSHCKIPKYEEMVFSVGTKLGAHHKFGSITADVLIESLQKSVLEGKVSLVPDVFYSTAGNYNVNTIDGCFKRLGLNSFMKELWRWPPLHLYLKRRYPDGGFEREKMEDLFSEIDDIVLRRNDIAHGKEITDRLSDTLILERIQFLRNVVTAINIKLDNHLLSLVWDNKANKYTPSKLRSNLKVIEMRGIGQVYLKRGSQIMVRKKANGLERFGFAIITDITNQNGRQITQVRSNGAVPRAFALKLDVSVNDIKEVCL